MSAQRFGLRGEQEGAALIAVVERLLANAVSCKVENAIPVVPDCKSEHSDETLESAGEAPFAESRQHDFRVAPAAETMASSLELRSQTPVIVDLAVEGHDEPTVFRTHRLVAVCREVQDRQAADPEGDAPPRIRPVALVVRTSMAQRLCHPSDRPCISAGFYAVLVEDACEAAHRALTPRSVAHRTPERHLGAERDS